MPSSARLEWNGDRLIAQVAEASRVAIDDVTDACDNDASVSHWWKNRTENLEREIVTEAAELHGDRVVGRFGTTYSGRKGVRSGFYGLFLEYRFPFLRPVADRHFPTLAKRIREKLR